MTEKIHRMFRARVRPAPLPDRIPSLLDIGEGTYGGPGTLSWIVDTATGDNRIVFDMDGGGGRREFRGDVTEVSYLRTFNQKVQDEIHLLGVQSTTFVIYNELPVTADKVVTKAVTMHVLPQVRAGVGTVEVKKKE